MAPVRRSRGAAGRFVTHEIRGEAQRARRVDLLHRAQRVHPVPHICLVDDRPVRIIPRGPARAALAARGQTWVRWRGVVCGCIRSCWGVRFGGGSFGEGVAG